MSPLFLVADIDRSIAFYTRHLGFKLDFRYEDFYCGLSRDGNTIHLKAAPTSEEERRNRRDNEHVDVTFLVEGIEGLYHEIGGKQAEIILQPLRDMPYGREFYVIDPDGYILAFLDGNHLSQ